MFRLHVTDILDGVIRSTLMSVTGNLWPVTWPSKSTQISFFSGLRNEVFKSFRTLKIKCHWHDSRPSLAR